MQRRAIIYNIDILMNKAGLYRLCIYADLLEKQQPKLKEERNKTQIKLVQRSDIKDMESNFLVELCILFPSTLCRLISKSLIMYHKVPKTKSQALNLYTYGKKIVPQMHICCRCALPARSNRLILF